LTPRGTRTKNGLNKMQYLSNYSHTEKQMILSNPNVIMRLERMLQAQQEFADAVAHASRDLRNTQEQNYYGTPVLHKAGGRARTPVPPRAPRKSTKKSEQIDGTPTMSRGVIYNDY
jgi:hypothetical protein